MSPVDEVIRMRLWQIMLSFINTTVVTFRSPRGFRVVAELFISMIRGTVSFFLRTAICVHVVNGLSPFLMLGDGTVSLESVKTLSMFSLIL